MSFQWRRKGPVKPRSGEDVGMACCRTMIEAFVNEIAGNAMRSVATVIKAAGLGDSVGRLDEPMQRLVVERLAARIAAGAEAEIFDREWVAFLAPAKPGPGAPDRRAQVLALLKDMAEARKADLPARPEPMTTLCGAIRDAGKYGPAIDKIVGKTVETILKRAKRTDCQGLRFAVTDQAIGLLFEMDEPDLDKLAIFMKVSVPEWVKRAVTGCIR